MLYRVRTSQNQFYDFTSIKFATATIRSAYDRVLGYFLVHMVRRCVDGINSGPLLTGVSSVTRRFWCADLVKKSVTSKKPAAPARSEERLAFFPQARLQMFTPLTVITSQTR